MNKKKNKKVSGVKEFDKFRKRLGEYEDWKEKTLDSRETRLREILQIPISHITENR